MSVPRVPRARSQEMEHDKFHFIRFHAANDSMVVELFSCFLKDSAIPSSLNCQFFVVSK